MVYRQNKYKQRGIEFSVNIFTMSIIGLWQSGPFKRALRPDSSSKENTKGETAPIESVP